MINKRCYRNGDIQLSTMTSHYFLRANSRNYRQLNTIKLPRAHKSSSKEKLYPIEVVEINGSRGRIHYVGYDDCFDEWRDLAELVNIPPSPSNCDDSAYETPIQQYSLHNELRIKIKQCLVFRAGKASPSVTIDMGFDYLLFKGGLQPAGVVKQHTRSLRYKLRSYKDLDPLLGQNWHYRGANEHGDYAFVILSSVEYYIHKRRKLIEYRPSQSAAQSTPVLHSEDASYALKFSFTRGYGNKSTFGKDRNIFSIS